MTINVLYKRLDTIIPRSLSCEWDNDGLMCCPDGTKEVRRVLVALDITDQTVQTAIDGGYDLIISHHPLIFKGLKCVNEDNAVAKKILKLIGSGISAFSFHTRLDAVNGGVNDTLASLIELEDVVPFGEEALGRIGTLKKPLPLERLALRLKTALCAEGVFIADSGRLCERVAVLGGNGSDDIDAAIAAGADTYISGTLKYHSMTDAPDMGINLIEAGHFYTEYPVCAVIKRMVEDIDSTIVCDLYNSNRIKLI